MAEEQQRRPLPRDPLEHHQDAEQHIAGAHAGPVENALVSALLAVAGELAEIKKLLRNRR
ncbi:hypothetical protein [Streptomyces fuscichromogenes]|uniref:Uncharacterized protein n=1 Tax=Streptomyces fuscichromogenes TaxID=1324013 RepID=A0A918CXQ6_9ACTN|nr:hypothetical protein [Streptomyces fuscichromogenes]GGN46773.1 hypothetical protein GCM10011578_099890 [Streptomyces fuscichromogenes]